jgi:hypothetical protein
MTELVRVYRTRIVPNEPPATRADSLLEHFQTAANVFTKTKERDQVFEVEWVTLQIAPHLVLL